MKNQMNRGANEKKYWNQKHINEYDTDKDYDFSQLENSPLSYHKVASDIIRENHFDIKNKSILEIGCATGYFLSYLSRFVLPKEWQLEGWDFSPSGINSAKRRNQEVENLKFFEVDILENDVRNDYGIICCFETLEHIAEDKNYQLLDNWLEHCEYLILSTVTTPDDCRGEHISHYEFDTFTKKGYSVLWNTKLSRIDLSNIGYNGDYYYVMFLIKGLL